MTKYIHFYFILEIFFILNMSKCYSLDCFNLSIELCPNINQCNCKNVSTHNITAAFCCNINTEDDLKRHLECSGADKNRLDAIHIRYAKMNYLNLEKITWRSLKDLSLTNGNITNIIGELPSHYNIKCLNLSSNGIVKFENRSLINLKNLAILDLSHNNLQYIPHFKKDKIILDISGNKPLLCASVNEALETNSIEFHNANNTMCLSSSTFHWFNTTEKVPLTEVEKYHKLHNKCIENCSCQPHRLDIVPGKPPTIAIKVNCSGLNLTKLPSGLPPNTISLNISNNNVSSLQPITDDLSYQNLRELYADNNKITSILPLEGSKFISNFVALNLRNNKINDLPAYVLSNIFDRNYDSKYVKIGLNKLKCDCNTAKVLKVWLLSKHKHIPDYDEIYCENFPSRVVDLDPSKLCQSQQNWTDYVFYIITAEVFLLICLIGKVSYDYWVFKTAGFLPWPASKMPKLPCDWLCE